jgi:hypothetical protein
MMSFEATIELRDGLDARLQCIRSERHIRPPVFKRPHCGHGQPHVSVRAMLLSLVRFDKATNPESREARAQFDGASFGRY